MMRSRAASSRRRKSETEEEIVLVDPNCPQLRDEAFCFNKITTWSYLSGEFETRRRQEGDEFVDTHSAWFIMTPTWKPERQFLQKLAGRSMVAILENLEKTGPKLEVFLNGINPVEGTVHFSVQGSDNPNEKLQLFLEEPYVVTYVRPETKMPRPSKTIFAEYAIRLQPNGRVRKTEQRANHFTLTVYQGHVEEIWENMRAKLLNEKPKRVFDKEKLIGLRFIDPPKVRAVGAPPIDPSQSTSTSSFRELHQSAPTSFFSEQVPNHEQLFDREIKQELDDDVPTSASSSSSSSNPLRQQHSSSVVPEKTSENTETAERSQKSVASSSTGSSSEKANVSEKASEKKRQTDEENQKKPRVSSSGSTDVSPKQKHADQTGKQKPATTEILPDNKDRKSEESRKNPRASTSDVPDSKRKQEKPAKQKAAASEKPPETRDAKNEDHRNKSRWSTPDLADLKRQEHSSEQKTSGSDKSTEKKHRKSEEPQKRSRWSSPESAGSSRKHEKPVQNKKERQDSSGKTEKKAPKVNEGAQKGTSSSSSSDSSRKNERTVPTYGLKTGAPVGELKKKEESQKSSKSSSSSGSFDSAGKQKQPAHASKHHSVTSDKTSKIEHKKDQSTHKKPDTSSSTGSVESLRKNERVATTEKQKTITQDKPPNTHHKKDHKTPKSLEPSSSAGSSGSVSKHKQPEHKNTQQTVSSDKTLEKQKKKEGTEKQSKSSSYSVPTYGLKTGAPVGEQGVHKQASSSDSSRKNERTVPTYGLKTGPPVGELKKKDETQKSSKSSSSSGSSVSANKQKPPAHASKQHTAPSDKDFKIEHKKEQKTHKASESLSSAGSAGSHNNPDRAVPTQKRKIGDTDKTCETQHKKDQKIPKPTERSSSSTGSADASRRIERAAPPQKQKSVASEKTSNFVEHTQKQSQSSVPTGSNKAHRKPELPKQAESPKSVKKPDSLESSPQDKRLSTLPQQPDAVTEQVPDNKETSEPLPIVLPPADSNKVIQAHEQPLITQEQQAVASSEEAEKKRETSERDSEESPLFSSSDTAELPAQQQLQPLSLDNESNNGTNQTDPIFSSNTLTETLQEHESPKQKVDVSKEEEHHMNEKNINPVPESDNSTEPVPMETTAPIPSTGPIASHQEQEFSEPFSQQKIVESSENDPIRELKTDEKVVEPTEMDTSTPIGTPLSTEPSNVPQEHESFKPSPGEQTDASGEHGFNEQLPKSDKMIEPVPMEIGTPIPSSPATEPTDLLREQVSSVPSPKRPMIASDETGPEEAPKTNEETVQPVPMETSAPISSPLSTGLADLPCEQESPKPSPEQPKTVSNENGLEKEIQKVDETESVSVEERVSSPSVGSTDLPCEQSEQSPEERNAASDETDQKPANDETIEQAPIKTSTPIPSSPSNEPTDFHREQMASEHSPQKRMTDSDDIGTEKELKTNDDTIEPEPIAISSPIPSSPSTEPVKSLGGQESLDSSREERASDLNENGQEKGPQENNADTKPVPMETSIPNPSSPVTEPTDLLREQVSSEPSPKQPTIASDETDSEKALKANGETVEPEPHKNSAPVSSPLSTGPADLLREQDSSEPTPNIATTDSNKHGPGKELQNTDGNIEPVQSSPTAEPTELHGGQDSSELPLEQPPAVLTESGQESQLFDDAMEPVPIATSTPIPTSPRAEPTDLIRNQESSETTQQQETVVSKENGPEKEVQNNDDATEPVVKELPNNDGVTEPVPMKMSSPIPALPVTEPTDLLREQECSEFSPGKQTDLSDEKVTEQEQQIIDPDENGLEKKLKTNEEITEPVPMETSSPIETPLSEELTDVPQEQKHLDPSPEDHADDSDEGVPKKKLRLNDGTSKPVPDLLSAGFPELTSEQNSPSSTEAPKHNSELLEKESEKMDEESSESLPVSAPKESTDVHTKEETLKPSPEQETEKGLKRKQEMSDEGSGKILKTDEKIDKTLAPQASLSKSADTLTTQRAVSEKLPEKHLRVNEKPQKRTRWSSPESSGLSQKSEKPEQTTLEASETSGKSEKKKPKMSEGVHKQASSSSSSDSSRKNERTVPTYGLKTGPPVGELKKKEESQKSSKSGGSHNKHEHERAGTAQKRKIDDKTSDSRHRRDQSTHRKPESSSSGSMDSSRKETHHKKDHRTSKASESSSSAGSADSLKKYKHSEQGNKHHSFSSDKSTKSEHRKDQASHKTSASSSSTRSFDPIRKRERSVPADKQKTFSSDKSSEAHRKKDHRTSKPSESSFSAGSSGSSSKHRHSEQKDRHYAVSSDKTSDSHHRKDHKSSHSSAGSSESHRRHESSKQSDKMKSVVSDPKSSMRGSATQHGSSVPARKPAPITEVERLLFPVIKEFSMKDHPNFESVNKILREKLISIFGGSESSRSGDLPLLTRDVEDWNTEDFIRFIGRLLEHVGGSSKFQESMKNDGVATSMKRLHEALQHKSAQLERNERRKQQREQARHQSIW